MQSFTFASLIHQRQDLSKDESSINQSLLNLIDVFRKHRDFWMSTTCHKTYEKIQKYYELFLNMHDSLHSSENQMEKLIIRMYKNEIQSIIGSLKSPRKNHQWLNVETIRNDLPNDIKIVKQELHNLIHKIKMFLEAKKD